MIQRLKRKAIDWMKEKLPEESTLRWVLATGYHHPIRWPLALFKSAYATFRLTGKLFPLRVRIPPQFKLRIEREKHANVLLNGNIFLTNWNGGNYVESSLQLRKNSTFEVSGDLVIAPDVHFSLAPHATLQIGKTGEKTAINSCTQVIVEKKVKIGGDCLIAKNVFISDSIWHNLEGTERCKDVTIGNHVWIAHECMVTKGATVPDGCVIGAKSLVTEREFNSHSLIAGIPAITKKTNIHWSP